MEKVSDVFVAAGVVVLVGAAGVLKSIDVMDTYVFSDFAFIIGNFEVKIIGVIEIYILKWEIQNE